MHGSFKQNSLNNHTFTKKYDHAMFNRYKAKMFLQ